MHIKLIIATKDRTTPLKRLIQSLNNQQYKNFSVTIVDQNEPGFLDSIINISDISFQLTTLQVNFRGVSRARNFGIQNTQHADIIAFPDDDCFYAPDTLELVASSFASLPDCDAILGKLVFSDSLSDIPIRTNKPHLLPHNRYTAFRHGGTVIHFFRRHIVDSVGGFDESLGPGAGTPYLSGEDTDYLVRAIDMGFACCTHPGVIVYHPAPDTNDRNLQQKAYGYGRGRGAILRKLNCPLWFIILNLIHPLITMPGKPLGVIRYKWHMLRGRVHELLMANYTQVDNADRP